ncbi:hypothetical protein Glove_669g17 [Diversispora epigaea]|uniref:Peptidase A2 domain-containing protein n=1 Tax=Diversispora epigaea TaxID=1348612 RepID=A0A397G9J1_9GLOM|nr:hypothetical protein Glove_669g17 [Diversispora epigaea]
MSTSVNEEKEKKSKFKIFKFLKSIVKTRKKASETLNPTTTEISNPPETIESLHKYETEPGQAQKFLDFVGQNFRWPASMEDCDRGMTFFFLVDESALKFDDEAAFNLIFFYNNIDKGTFDEHQDSWVLVYNQEVKGYGSEYTGKELEDLEREMPGAVYLPVDKSRRDDLVKSPPARNSVRIQVRRSGTTDSVIREYNFNDPVENEKLYKSVIDSGAPETTLPCHARRMLGREGWKVKSSNACGYGYPARVFYATSAFEVAIGDNNGWSKWVITNTLRVWQRKPGNQVDSSLIGTDVLDQFSFVHEATQNISF